MTAATPLRTIPRPHVFESAHPAVSSGLSGLYRGLKEINRLVQDLDAPGETEGRTSRHLEALRRLSRSLQDSAAALVAQIAPCAISATADCSGESAAQIDLSGRESEIMGWIARGKRNVEIAQILDISPHTVDTHLRRAYRKLDVYDRTSAAVRAIDLGLIRPVF